MFHLTAITRRRDALFQTSTIGGKSLSRTDTAQLNGVRTEVDGLARARNRGARAGRASMRRTSSGGMYTLRVAIRQRVPGEARNAIAACFGALTNVKHVFVVDPDIDIFSDEQMDWAFATRFQADRDLMVMDRHARGADRSVADGQPHRRQGRLRPDLAARRRRNARTAGAGAADASRASAFPRSRRRSPTGRNSSRT